eukprot:TRINITY_DN22653_c0_g1_i1.p1 TRINITY_DN22653_c0_g1~~TRINITY_DN22653_c0_g1_i1.p1  ORF type:complete len:155 (+),score=9.33 TRINITY_DN22653_c0_g1_i1:143-607(+)
MTTEQAQLDVLPGQPQAKDVAHSASSESTFTEQLSSWVHTDSNKPVRASQTTAATVEDELKNAVRQVSLQRSRMRVRAITCSACFCTAAIACLGVSSAPFRRNGAHSAVYVIGSLLLSLGVFFSLLALLPSDDRFIVLTVAAWLFFVARHGSGS